MLGKIGGRRMKYAADAAVERNLAAADCVDRYAGRIGRIFDRKFQVNFHWHIAEHAAFHTNEGNFVVELPWYVIARADMDVLVYEAIAHYRLYCLGFRSFLRRQPGAIKHV